MMLNKNACIQKMKRRLEELKRGIEKLEGKPHLAEVKIMTAHQSKMSALRLQLQQALVYLDEVKASGEANWEYVKAKAEKALDAIDHSIRDFKSRS